MACYFERRLTKGAVQSIDLKHTLRLLSTLFKQGSIDYRTLINLLYGFSKILARQMNYLLSESTTTLESLKNPFTDEDPQQKSGVKKPYTKRNKDLNYQAPPKVKNMIDLTRIKYPGLDNNVLNQL